MLYTSADWRSESSKYKLVFGRQRGIFGCKVPKHVYIYNIRGIEWSKFGYRNLAFA